MLPFPGVSGLNQEARLLETEKPKCGQKLQRDHEEEARSLDFLFTVRILL